MSMRSSRSGSRVGPALVAQIDPTPVGRRQTRASLRRDGVPLESLHGSVADDQLAQAESAQMGKQQQREGHHGTGEVELIEAHLPEGEADLRAQIAALQGQLAASEQARQRQAHSAALPQASPMQSPQESPQGSPRASPQASPRGMTAASQRSKPQPPRLSDLDEYDGASGAKLEEWLAKLRRVARYAQLSDADAVEFALVHLVGAADVWWSTLDEEEYATSSASMESFSAALRSRFQPITTTRVAREQLHRLAQGNRLIDAYVAEFNQLHAQVPDMSEADARAQFVRGLRKEIADRIEEDEWEAMPLAKVIAKAARVGNRACGSTAKVALSQMESAAPVDQSELQAAINRAVLNALASQSPQVGGATQSSGLGAKTQTQRGYANARARGGSAPRFRERAPFQVTIPGVPSQVIEQRRAAGLCFRCGGEHRVIECPNAISAQQSSN